MTRIWKQTEDQSDSRSGARCRAQSAFAAVHLTGSQYILDAGGIRVVVVDVIREPSNGRRIIAFGDIYDLPRVQVDE